MEADFRQFYHADLRDLYDDDSDMTVRWVVDMLEELPSDSRIIKDFKNDPLSEEQHLQLTIVDALNQVIHQTSLTAAHSLGEDYSKYAKQAPKPIERPKIRSEKVEKKFATIHELKELFGKVN